MAEQEKSQGESLSWRTQFRVELYLILVGLSFGFSIENLLPNPSPPTVFRFIATVIMLVVWLHAQMGFASSGKTFDVGATPTWLGTVLLHYGEITSLTLLVVVALVQQCAAQFYVAVAAAHGFDLLVQAIHLVRLRKRDCRIEQRKKLARDWLFIDLIMIATTVAARLIMARCSECCVSLAVLAVTIATTLWDYGANQSFYFGLSECHKEKSGKADGKAA